MSSWTSCWFGKFSLVGGQGLERELAAEYLVGLESSHLLEVRVWREN